MKKSAKTVSKPAKKLVRKAPPKVSKSAAIEPQPAIKVDAELSFIDFVKNGFKTLAFNGQAALENANASSATKWGFLMLVIIGIIDGLSSMYDWQMGGAPYLAVKSFLISPFLVILMFFVCYSIFHALAKVFGGVATGTQYFRVLTAALVINGLTSLVILALKIAGGVMLPGSLTILSALWVLAVNAFILIKIHRLSTTKGILLGAVMPITVGIIIVIFTAFFMYRAYMG